MCPSLLPSALSILWSQYPKPLPSSALHIPVPRAKHPAGTHTTNFLIKGNNEAAHSMRRPGCTGAPQCPP